MKKLITVLIVLAVLLCMAIAGALGYMWYKDNHIFVDEAVYPIDSVSLDLRGQEISEEHYNSVHSQLPNCEILWDVTFQGTKYSSDITALTVSTLSDEDIQQMDYFEGLETVDASACQEYDQIEKLKAHRPECQVIYQISLGVTSYDPETVQLELENGEYEFDVMLENLKYLPNLQSIHLRMPELTQEQIGQLEAAYEGIAITCSVELMGQEYSKDVTELDLSAMTSEDVAAVVEKLPLLPSVTAIELMDASGKSQLTKEDVKTLMEAAPQAVFNYSFEFYGKTLSTSDEEVHIHGKRIGDQGEADIRLALDLLPNCKRFVLEYCSVSNEVLAKIRDDYRDRTKVVWRVFFGKGSTMTDAEIIRCTYDLTDDNCYDLIYCEDVRFVDIGHNEYLDTIPFVAGMTNLEVIIVSGAPIKDLTPFENCKKLKVLELAFCNYVVDISPLAGCESLEMLNIGYTHATDLSALDDLNLTHLCIDKAKIPTEERERYSQLKPDCWITYNDSQPYNSGWRYTKENKYLDWYAQIREVFRYDRDPNIPNNTGWYLS